MELCVVGDAGAAAGALVSLPGALVPLPGALVPLPGALVPQPGALVPLPGALVRPGALGTSGRATPPRVGERRNSIEGTDLRCACAA